MEYLAHTRNDQGEWHYLNDHLNKVADLAKEYAQGFYGGQITPLAELIGLLHDLGKVNPGFQRYLLSLDEGKIPQKVPHSPWSALFIYLTQNNNSIRKIVGLPVAGHHGGLDEPGTLSAKLNELDKNNMDRAMVMLMQNAVKDFVTGRSMSSMKLPNKVEALQLELLIRMLFSTLIDADRADTEGHFNPEKKRLRNFKYSVEELAVIFREKQKVFIGKSQKDKPTIVNQVRKQIYDECLKAATGNPGLYRLTVPTGGGKTRSVLGFALEHAVVNKQKRIVFALPYTSIIDQTAQIYRDIFGKEMVLEHHSQVQYKDDDEEQDPDTVRLRLAQENWDVPLVVTTTVQLLESLFSNNPSRCRKIHNLAQSVIILDEAQSLPLELFKPTLQVLRDLAENYGTTVVLSTATQPALQGDYLTELNSLEIQEIVPEYQQYYQKLVRVYYKKLPVPISVNDLAEEIAQYHQVLVIMNTRKQALQLVKALKGRSCLHLSTLLCGSHRQHVLQNVREVLVKGEPLCLISTQVVEAGVDLDFPVVYRALGPLDRIVQAAGRCNREGKPELGQVTIFELLEEAAPRGPYKAGIEMAKLILSEYENPEILNDPSIFEEYFSRLYSTLGNDLDKYRIQLAREQLNYIKTAQEYRLIKDNTVSVAVRYGNYHQALDSWLKYPGRDSWRRIQPYLVNIYEWESKVLINNGVLRELTKGLYLWEGVYDPLTGVSEVELDPADLIV